MCALIHKYMPEAIDFESLSFTPENSEKNLNLAFSIASQKFGVPAINTKDIIGTPNKRAVTNYLVTLRTSLEKIHSPSKVALEKGVKMTLSERKSRLNKKAKEENITKVVDQETPTKLVRTGSVKLQVQQTRPILARTKSMTGDPDVVLPRAPVDKVIRKQRVLNRAKSDFYQPRPQPLVQLEPVPVEPQQKVSDLIHQHQRQKKIISLHHWKFNTCCPCPRQTFRVR